MQLLYKRHRCIVESHISLIATMSRTSEEICITNLYYHQQRCKRQLQWLLDQSHQLSLQYHMWQVRHQRACKQKSPAFRYILHLRLITVKGLMAAFAEKMQQKAMEILDVTAFLDASEIMGQTEEMDGEEE